jgi:hypothetical protein
MARTAYIAEDNDGVTIDPLTAYPTVDVLARNLRPGMILVDPELGTPLVQIDARVRSTPRSGNVSFNVWNLESGRFEPSGLHLRPTLTVPAIAR